MDNAGRSVHRREIALLTEDPSIVLLRPTGARRLLALPARRLPQKAGEGDAAEVALDAGHVIGRREGCADILRKSDVRGFDAKRTPRCLIPKCALEKIIVEGICVIGNCTCIERISGTLAFLGSKPEPIALRSRAIERPVETGQRFLVRCSGEGTREESAVLSRLAHGCSDCLHPRFVLRFRHGLIEDVILLPDQTAASEAVFGLKAVRAVLHPFALDDVDAEANIVAVLLRAQRAVAQLRLEGHSDAIQTVPCPTAAQAVDAALHLFGQKEAILTVFDACQIVAGGMFALINLERAV